MRDTTHISSNIHTIAEHMRQAEHTVIGSDSGKLTTQHRRLCRFYTLQSSCVQWSGTLNGALYLHIKECWAIS